MDDRALGSQESLSTAGFGLSGLAGRIQTREAQPGYAPDPDWSKVPPWDELVTLGFGAHGIIRDKDHPIYHEQIGAAPNKKPTDDLDGPEL